MTAIGEVKDTECTGLRDSLILSLIVIDLISQTEGNSVQDGHLK